MTKIQVTEEHILRARVLVREGGCMESNCPVALALHAAGFEKALVCLSHFQLDGVSSPSIPHPRSVNRFVGWFDDSRPVVPFSFMLPV